jgi:hypothetical protein
MRARDIVGKKVAKVVQERTTDNNGFALHALVAVVFHDGTELQFCVAEMPGDYAVTGVVVKKERRQHE